MSDEPTPRQVTGSDEIIELIKEQSAQVPDFSYRDYRIEDYFALGVFWILALMVFSQFFTRYFLGFSYAWTEEGARYLLVCVTFLGSVMAVRRNSHIFVEFFYRYLPRKTGRALVTLVDAIRILFLAAAVRLGIAILPRTMNNFLSTVRIPLAAVYSVVTFGMALMLFRAVQLAVLHWRDGYVPGSREDRSDNS
ncbi:MAG: TRAP transporter small permease [Spirochaetaceae bacterium]|nr:MAG: TRAP transporter small permease [Spirochaetaceae bacterium]